jgi:hypothetical protein
MPRCRRPWEIKLLGKRLCAPHWLDRCTDEAPAPSASRRLTVVRPAPYELRASTADDGFVVSDWLPPTEIPGVE